MVLLAGLAAIHIINDDYAQAVETYREVLRSVEQHRNQLKTDSLQQLHALHNLQEVLSQNHPNIPPTLRDGKLKDEVCGNTAYICRILTEGFIGNGDCTSREVHVKEL